MSVPDTSVAGGPPAVVASDVPRFEVGDPAALDYLNENGYALFKDVIDATQIETAKGLFWNWAESLGTGIDRNDMTTWGNDRWPDDFSIGLMNAHNVGQSEYVWFCRGLPKVKQIYANIWATEKLLVSFDGCNAFRPVDVNPEWKTGSGWYHADQNCTSKTGRHCVQGLLNLLPAGRDRGGLVVVPKSVKAYEKYTDKNQESLKGERDFIFIQPQQWGEFFANPIKVNAQPGDFVVWDSRTVHCNTSAVNEQTTPAEQTPHLDRMVVYICMTPVSLAENLEELLAKKKDAVEKGLTTNHWPHEFHTVPPHDSERNLRVKKTYTPPVLSHAQKLLAGIERYD